MAEVVRAGVAVLVAAGNSDTDACLKSPARSATFPLSEPPPPLPPPKSPPFWWQPEPVTLMHAATALLGQSPSRNFEPPPPTPRRIYEPSLPPPTPQHLVSVVPLLFLNHTVWPQGRLQYLQACQHAWLSLVLLATQHSLCCCYQLLSQEPALICMHLAVLN